MSRKQVDTLLIDLDNTIFDWFSVWYASFHPLYEEIVRRTGIPAEEVEADIRRVHQKQRTSEYTFLLEEMESLGELRANGDIRQQFDRALQQSAQGRDRSLKLYQGVFRSLWDIKKAGTRIVAYTESMSFYSAYRLKRFGLDGVIDVLFSPQDHDIPIGMSPGRIRRLPDEFYELQVTEIRHTPAGELKPNPKVLLEIIRQVGSDPTRCAYVGDSLFKDIAMARDANVFDIHASYGESQRLPEYDLLRRVSHWTEEDVLRERFITERGHNFKPSAVLHETFAEIFAHCEFQSATPQERAEADKIASAIETWKKTVDVQQHFNDLELRVRNMAMTVIGALLAAVGFTYQQGLMTNFVGYTLPSGLGFVAAAIFAWGGFFFMDRYWYHILLRGAVAHASLIENQFSSAIPGICLGGTISKASQDVRVFGLQMNSTRRLNAFYAVGLMMLALVFACLFLAAPPSPKPVVDGRSMLSSPGRSQP